MENDVKPAVEVAGLEKRLKELQAQKQEAVALVNRLDEQRNNIVQRAVMIDGAMGEIAALLQSMKPKTPPSDNKPAEDQPA